MRRLIKYITVLFLILIVGVTALIGGTYWYITNNDVKDILATVVKRSTGHELFIMGEAKLKLWPAPSLVATDIRIPAFNGDNPIFTAQKLDASAQWGMPPFIWKGIELTSLTADAPNIYLRENKKGLANWESPVRGREGFAGASSGGEASNSIESVGNIALNNVTVTYVGDKSGTNVNVKNLNLTVDGNNLKTTKIKASGKVNKKDLTIDGTLDMTSNTWPAHLKLAAAGANVNFLGQLGTGTPTGKVTVSGNNLRQTLASFVEPAAVTSLPSRSFTVSSQVKPDGNITHLDDFKIELGGVLNASGKLKLTQRGKRSPVVNADLTFSKLNLNALGVCGASGASGGGSVRGGSGSASNDWDTTPIDLSFIRSANWDVNITANTLTCSDAPINSFRLSAENDGLTVKVKQLTVAFPKNGNLETSGTVKYGNRILANLNTTLTTLPIEIFLSKPGDLVVPLSGNFDLSLEGASIKDLMQSLNGTAILSASNAVLPAKQLEVLAGKLSSIIGGGTRTANFDFNARYDIAKGIADTKEFKLKTKDGFLTVGGEGKIDIGNRAISYRLTPKATTNGGLFKGGLALPVTVQGKWHNIKVRPDSTITKGVTMGIGAAVGGPAGVAVGNAVGSLLSGDKNAVGNLIQGVGSLLDKDKRQTAPINPNDSEDAATTEEMPVTPQPKKPEEQVKDAVENLLNGLF